MTQSGPQGILLSGGQNEKVKPAYSPAATIIKESVGDIQKIADSINMTSVTGEAGRFNHILIDPHKMNFNKGFLNNKVPQELAKIRDYNKSLVENMLENIIFWDSFFTSDISEEVIWNFINWNQVWARDFEFLTEILGFSVKH